MPRGFPVGRLFGTDIEATPGFLVLLGVYFVLNPAAPAYTAVFCIAVVLSLLVHEFGHVLAVRRLLGADCRVLLWGLGGLCVYGRVPPPKEKIAISLAGPLLGFVAGGAALAALGPAGAHPLLHALVFDLAWIGFAWGLLNLLPIHPLDGGQALQATLLALGARGAGTLTRRVSIGTAAAGCAAALHFGYPFAAVIAALLLVQNVQRSPYD